MPSYSRIHLLSDKEYQETLERCSPAIENADDPKVGEMVYDELNRLDDILRPAIDARWKETDAFYGFNDDWNVCWVHSMTVCSDQMCCGEFLEIIQRVLPQMEHAWCFVVEFECNTDWGFGPRHAGFGEIFFYRGEIFGNKSDDFDYALFNA